MIACILRRKRLIDETVVGGGSRLCDSNSRRPSREITTKHSVAPKANRSSNIGSSEKEESIKQSPPTTSKSNLSSTRDEVVDLTNDDKEEKKSTAAAALPPNLLETSTPRQKFPNGTPISRVYSGVVLDYGYFKQRKGGIGWFYLIRYDDGSTDFLDEREVAKFSTATRC